MIDEELLTLVRSQDTSRRQSDRISDRACKFVACGITSLVLVACLGIAKTFSHSNTRDVSNCSCDDCNDYPSFKGPGGVEVYQFYREVRAPMYWRGHQGRWQYVYTAPVFADRDVRDLAFSEFKISQNVDDYVEVPTAPFIGRSVHMLKAYNRVDWLDRYTPVCVHSLVDSTCQPFLVPCPVDWQDPSLDAHADFLLSYERCRMDTTHESR